MRELIVLGVKVLDPISFGLAFLIILFSRNKAIILVSASITAVVIETLLTSSQYTRSWGQGIVPGFIAALIQAGVSYWIVGLFRKKKRQSLTRPDQEASNSIERDAP